MTGHPLSVLAEHGCHPSADDSTPGNGDLHGRSDTEHPRLTVCLWRCISVGRYYDWLPSLVAGSSPATALAVATVYSCLVSTGRIGFNSRLLFLLKFQTLWGSTARVNVGFLGQGRTPRLAVCRFDPGEQSMQHWSSGWALGFQPNEPSSILGCCSTPKANNHRGMCLQYA